MLGNLPTPATYVVTFARDGYGTQTSVIDLGAGQNRAGLTVSLASGTGSVTGTLLGSNGLGLGGATVTVGGSTVAAGGTSPTTTTLTNGAVGTFAINGLTAPGSYTLTFTHGGYSATTVPVNLTGNGAPPVVTVTLSVQQGQITGLITDSRGQAFVGATITATNGTKSWTATSTASGPNFGAGGYIIPSLQPGTYTVTVTAPNMTQQTALVTVVAGKTATQNLELGS